MRKLLLPAGFVIIAVFVFFSSFYYFFNQKDTNPKGSPGVSPKTGFSNIIASDKPVFTPTPSIDWSSVIVPEPGTSANSGFAVPIAVYDTSAGKKMRQFDLIAEGNNFSIKKIAVNQDDIINLGITAKDRDYDVTIDKYGNNLTVPVGRSLLLQFQTVIPGVFTFSCSTCQSSSIGSKPQGRLYIKPSLDIKNQ
jgi:heme/copper-type cytochrome/quinol oxidase subunit 2